MNGAHASGGGLGALVGAVVAQALKKWAGIDLDSADSALIGAAAAAAGLGAAHVFTTSGLLPAVRRALFGPKPSAPPA